MSISNVQEAPKALETEDRRQDSPISSPLSDNNVFKIAPYSPSVLLQAPYPENTTFPLSLTPTSPSPTLSSLTSAIRDLTATGTITDLLNNHGAIHFQNLHLSSAEEFSQFAQSFCWVPHEDIGNPVRRTVLAYNVATANESPNTQPIGPHNEFGLSPHYPAYLFFYCAEAPETGGETPINSSVVLYARLKKEHPEFIEELEKKGVKYSLFHANGSRDQTKSPGTTVLQAYGKHVLDSDSVEVAREKIEKEIKRLPTATWEWKNQSDENQLGVAALASHPTAPSYEPNSVFNNIVSRYLFKPVVGTSSPQVQKESPRYPSVLYGDRSEIPSHYLDSAYEIIKDTRSLVSWSKGDVLLIDNHAVQHGREPWTGQRRLLASLWDEPVYEDLQCVDGICKW